MGHRLSPTRATSTCPRSGFASGLVGGLLLVLAFCCAGCATSGVLPRMSGENGEPVFRKRYARFLERDFIARLSSTAYRRALGSDFEASLSPDQEMILADLGQPELMRLPYRSREGELVEEWAFMEKQRIAQFVEGLLVHEGPLTDYERVLIEHGYPDEVSESKFHGPGEMVHFSYHNPVFLRDKQFSFSNDKLIYVQDTR